MEFCRGQQWRLKLVLLLLLLLLQVWASTCVNLFDFSARVAPLNGLTLHYYKHNTSCTYAEELVRYLVNDAWKADRSVTAALLRLVYSDCLVTGCDASILLDGYNTEKSAIQNQGLRTNGLNLIDVIKSVLEARCPGVVSCADILNLATKEAVALAGAPKYPVYTGRRDGSQSTAQSVDLPPPDVTWEEALAYFESKDLDVLDLGTLLGAHSVGMTHCSNIQDRLYNFNGTGRPDSSMDPNFLAQLKKKCPPGSKKNRKVYLNPASGRNYSFENSYYKRVLKHQAVFTEDQQMITTTDGIRIAHEFAAGFEDLRKFFALSMTRMGGLGVLTGKQGEIRLNCRYTNANNPHLK
ncbi:hypothetical protein IEQ34_001185 [Dendrobium chrysotoxum]|uniref:Peroxidase n=1 Tax=Dendrobium chrysotoxum TaxID=161865 RepID=A0AAV7HML4_DENCH|nr:hypothetical protein IEQ34_001185 [Dendrobium chrysotoxum]